MSKIYVAGDWHGQWGRVNTFINRKHPNIILQCGDYGWFPAFHNTAALDTRQNLRRRKWNQYGLKPQNTKIYWCDGNHEDHWSLEGLRQFDASPIEVQPNVYYMSRGSTLKLDNGATVLFMGGAESIDKEIRTLGHDWWPQEVISHSEIYNLPEKQIDIVISHTCPMEFYTHLHTYKYPDPSMWALSHVLDKYMPKLWYFGHFHQFVQGIYMDTVHWTCLGMVPETNWWIPIDEEKLK